MLTIVAFVFVLGVLIFVHELGHFLMAKRLGIRVTRFQLGFDPKLVVLARRGGTEYSIGAIPFGGFVKMAGENPDEARTGDPGEFLSRSKWDRFQVLVMGPAMNVVLAIVLMWVVLLQGADVPAFQDQAPIVGTVVVGSPAERAGVRPQDRIVSLSGRRTDTWEQFYIAVGGRANREVPLVVARAGQELMLRVTPDAKTKYELGDIGVLPDVHPSIRAVLPGQPAEKAGLRAGDAVTAVDGARMTFSRELRDAIAKRPGVPVTMSIERNGSPLTVVVTPAREGASGRIGVQIGDEIKTIKPGPIEAIGMSVRRNYEFSGLIVQTLAGLLTRETSPRQLMGPVAIAQLSGEYAAAGLIALMTLIASLSLNLGILNLLPIPILDGGHIFIMMMEGLARRDFSVKMKERMLLAGFVVLVLLMVTVIYNDLTRIQWIERLMFWR